MLSLNDRTKSEEVPWGSNECSKRACTKVRELLPARFPHIFLLCFPRTPPELTGPKQSRCDSTEIQAQIMHTILYHTLQ